MPRDVDAIKVLENSDRWCQAVPADRAGADLSALTEAIDRAIGWTVAHGPNGDRDLQQEVWNQLWYEMSTAMYECNSIGIFEYDDGVVFEQGAIVNDDGTLKRALLPNGPGTTNGIQALTEAAYWVDQIGNTESDSGLANLPAALLKVKKWARDGLRTDPEATGLDPTLVRGNGWTDDFSNANPGYTLRRSVLNQLYCEFFSIILEWLTRGVFEHHEDIVYKQYAIVQRGHKLYYRNTAGSGAWAAADWTVIDGEVDVPDSITDLAANEQSFERIRLTFTTPAANGSAITGITLQRSTNQNFTAGTVTTFNLAADATQYDDDTVNTGTPYWYRAYATNGEGDADFSNVVTETAEADNPSPPRNTALSLTMNETIDVDWDLSANNGGSPILCHDIQWRTAGQQWSTARQISVGATETEAQIGGLTNGVQVEVRVGARSSIGVGWSADGLFETPTAFAPGKVQSIATSGTANTITGVATPPPANGDPINNYRFGIKRTNVNESYTYADSSDNTHTFTGLTPDTEYDIIARAENTIGDGEDSDPVTHETSVAQLQMTINNPAGATRIEYGAPVATAAQRGIASGGDGNYVFSLIGAPSYVTISQSGNVAELEIDLDTTDTEYTTIYTGSAQEFPYTQDNDYDFTGPIVTESFQLRVQSSGMTVTLNVTITLFGRLLQIPRSVQADFLLWFTQFSNTDQAMVESGAIPGIAITADRIQVGSHMNAAMKGAGTPTQAVGTTGELEFSYRDVDSGVRSDYPFPITYVIIP